MKSQFRIYIVAAGIADEALIQVAYAIGVAEPVGFSVNTNGTAKVKDQKGKILSDKQISDIAFALFGPDLRPYAIITKFGLQNPVFEPTCTYGHFGRDYYTREVEVYYQDKDTVERIVVKNDKEAVKYFKKVNFFAWEKLDSVDAIKKAFNISH